MKREEGIECIYYIQQSEMGTGSELEGHRSFVDVRYEPVFREILSLWFCRAVSLSRESLQLDF